MGLFKNFVKAIDQNVSGFGYLQQMFSAKSEAKLKAGRFFGPEIRKLMNDKLFEESLNPLKRKLGSSFAWWSKTSYATVNHLHVLALSRIFYQVTKISGQKCH